MGEPHTLHCGKCFLCRRGHIQNCLGERSPGWGIDGAFTKYLKYPTNLLHRIPDTMSFEHAALVEPAANTVTDIVDRKAIEVGDFVVVLGRVRSACWRPRLPAWRGPGRSMMVGAPPDEALRLATARELGSTT